MAKLMVRVDAGERLGLGHLARCRVLARVLKQRGHSLILCGPSARFLDDADTVLFEQRIERAWNEDEASWLSAFCHEHQAALIVDDFRASSPAFQKTLYQHNVKWLQFVSCRYTMILATLALDYTPGRQARDYADNVIGGHCRGLFGERYLLLRPEFCGRQSRTLNARLGHVTVAFGGGDDRGALTVALSALADVAQITTVRVIIGRNHPDIDRIKAFASDRVSVLVGPDNIDALLLDTDLFITAGGTMSLEACALGTPTVLINIAQNQYANAAALHARQAAINLGPLQDVTESALYACLERLQDYRQRLSLSSNAMQVVSGEGAEHVADAVEDYL